MASDLSPYFGNIILRWLNGDAAMPSEPAGLYVSLWNGNPKAGGTEVSATVNAGGRQAVTFTALASGATHSLISDAACDYGASAGATSISYLGLHDASSAGNMFASKAIVGGAQAVAIGSPVKFLAGGITFNIGSDT
jgi:hypothetical protein